MASAPYNFDAADKALLTEMQKQFPLTHRPFQVLGEKVGIAELDCLERVGRLKSTGVIRQLSAIFDTRALGYQSSLVAMMLEQSRVEEAVQIINQHPGVSHNYKRDDRFNIWFTIAVPPSDTLEQVIQILHALAGSDETIILPTLRLYKIGVKLDLTDQGELLEEPDEIYGESRQMSQRPPLSTEDIRFIRIMQEDLPLLEIPYAVWAEQSDSTEEELFTWARTMEQRGYLRRFAAILSHRKAGFLANAMVVWQVPEEQVDTVGEQMALFREVSHCYRRPTYPNWPYAIFTMIHGRTYDACMEVVKRIEERVGQFQHKGILSIKEYKKIRVKYFTPELDDWWKNIGSKVSL